MALDNAEQILKMELDPKSPHFAKVLAMKQPIINSILSVTARVNSSQLRGVEDDGMNDVFDKIKQARSGQGGDQ